MSAFDSDVHFFPLEEWRTKNLVKQARVSSKNDTVIVDWEVSEDDEVNEKSKTISSEVKSSAYPFIWLRDFCHCEECFDEPSDTKKTNLQDINVNIRATDVSLKENGKFVHVHWDDDHQSTYPAAWLWCHRFHDTAPDPFIDLPPELWTAETFFGRRREFQFSDLMTSDRALYDWMKELKVFGMTLVKNAPQDVSAINTLGKRVDYLKDTCFGLVGAVYAPTDPNNPDYTAGNLYFHTDMTYYNQQPGIELLHCIKQFEGEGGDSTLVDGFAVASQIRENDPEAFEALTSNEVEFYQIGLKGYGKYFQLARNKIIKLDSNGGLQHISYSNHSRTSILRMRPEKVTQFYKAMRLFVDTLYDPKNMITFKMEPGDIIVLNNFRLLHGRKGFEMKKGSVRHLATGYMDWDLVYSKMRILHNKLSSEEVNTNTNKG